MQFGKSQHLASYVSCHNAMAYDICLHASWLGTALFPTKINALEEILVLHLVWWKEKLLEKPF
jgi:hypothetical protein